MSKNTIKKIILTIIILTVLILSLIFFYRITSENRKKDISIIKKIITEKYENVVYFDNSYLYAYKENEYTIFDYNGNKLYSFEDSNLNIVTVSKKYFITKDNNYHLYNTNYEEIVSGNNIYGITDYLVFVDNNIINTKGEILFTNVKNIKSYYKNKYFVVDNSFINEKGKELLYGYDVVSEKINANELDYFIVKKDNKYYSFFPLVNNIIGDEFDKYFEYNDEIYIISNNKIYVITTNGLRKEITFNVDKNINKVDYKNAVRKNRVLTIRDYYLGILETDTNKFHKIKKAKKYSYKFIDNRYINILCDDQNIVYDLDNYKIKYTGSFEEITIFKNNYKTIKKNGIYYLLDNKERTLAVSDKQIILLDSEISVGRPNDQVILFDEILYSGEKITINDKTYYKYEKDGMYNIISSDLKEKYESKEYINYMNDTIVKKENNNLYFINLKNGKTYSYNLKKYKIRNKDIYKNAIILSDDKNIIVLNKKGKSIKKIRNVKLLDIFYNDIKQSIIITVENNKGLKGAYVLK